MAYAKLDHNFSGSSIWWHGLEMAGFWALLLSLCDSDGIIRDSIPALAATARTTPERITALLTILESPDEYSRTPDNDGRRIAICRSPWGIRILNYIQYVEKDHTAASRQARYRARLKARLAAAGNGSGDAINVTSPVRPRNVTHVDVDVDVSRGTSGSPTTPPVELSLEPPAPESPRPPTVLEEVERYVKVFNLTCNRRVMGSSQVYQAWQRAVKKGTKPEELVVMPILQTKLNESRKDPRDLQPDIILRDGSTGTHNWIGEALRAADGMVLRGRLARVAVEAGVERELLSLGVRLEA